MARSINILWNVMFPIVLFFPMSFTAYRFILGDIASAGITKYMVEQCPTPIQGRLPFQLQYFGGYAPALENTLCILVAFFHPIFQPEAKKYTPFVIDFLISLSACVVIPFIEASRLKRPLLLGFPVVVELICQLITAAVTFPAYWAVFLVVTRDHTTDSKIAQADAEAVLFGLVMGYFLPSFAMAYIASPETTAVWQFFPVLIYFFKTIHLLFRPRRLHNTSGYRTVQATYAIIFLVSSIVHLRTLAAYNFDPQIIVTSFVPSLEIPVAGQTALAGIYLFLQWDALILFSSTFLASLWFAGNISRAILMVIWIVTSLPILGAGATVSGIFLWREANLNYSEQFPTLKLAKTQ